MPDDPNEKTDKPKDDAPAPTGAGEQVSASGETKQTDAAKQDAPPASDRPEGMDAFRPEEIAKRIERLGGETEEQRLAREEEQKLQQRRREQKKTGKKGKKGLEAAASKRLAKIAVDKPVKRAVALAADADPLIERTAKISAWAQKNQKVASYLVAGALLALLGAGIWMFMQQKREINASTRLSEAVADERGRVGDPSSANEPKDQLKDPRPIFKTNDERRDSALAKYKDVEAKYPGTGAAYLARLGEASILLDKKDGAGAVAAYEDVKACPLGRVDAEVKGRALEGVGFANELLAMQQPETKDKYLDAALVAFKALADVDGLGMKQLGQYHQARVLEAKGDTEGAVKLLKEVHDATSRKFGEAPKADDDTAAFFYLRDVADDRLRLLDRSAIPSKSMQKMYDAIQMQQAAGGGGAPPMMPPRPPGK